MSRTSKRARLFAGDELRTMRGGLHLSQVQMAGRLGISVSYLSQMESGDRPVTTPMLNRISSVFPLEWADVSSSDEDTLLTRAHEAGSDLSVPLDLIDQQAVSRAVEQQPALSRRLVALHAAFQRAQEQLRILDDRLDTGSDGSPLPWEEVRDWFQTAGNYLDGLDRLAERRAQELGILELNVAGLADHLRQAHDIEVVEASSIRPNNPIRTYEKASRILAIDPTLSIQSQRFQIAHQLMRSAAVDEIEDVAGRAALSSNPARQLLGIGLANYAAGALLMPYGRFRAEARRVRHDVDELRQLFSVSFEQACHRLSTLQRPGSRGLPFFFCRIDMAGNVTKRHSATRLQFAQLGGTCPLWIVHEAVAIPDRIQVQLAETPDGVRYISMAKGLVKATSSFRRPPRRYAVALGCEIEHRADFVYGDSLDISAGAATPIGSSCRICPRQHCEQRAFPPAGSALSVDPDWRNVVPYSFA